ncbi:hypothetical protein SRHO_G00283970 [Serrasalmus rhombeus]
MEVRGTKALTRILKTCSTFSLHKQIQIGKTVYSLAKWRAAEDICGCLIWDPFRPGQPETAHARSLARQAFSHSSWPPALTQKRLTPCSASCGP